MSEEPAGGSLAEQAASWVPPWARTPVQPREETAPAVDAGTPPAVDAEAAPEAVAGTPPEAVAEDGDDGAAGAVRSPEVDEPAMAAGAAAADRDIRHEFPPEPEGGEPAEILE